MGQHARSDDLYDGAEGVRYDAETGLSWMRARADDPALGRFLSHDPLGRLAALGLDTEPYVYAGNNPVNQTDSSGMYFSAGPGSNETAIRTSSGKVVITSGGNNDAGSNGAGKGPKTTKPPKPKPLTHDQMVQNARNTAQGAASHFMDAMKSLLVVAVRFEGLALALQGAAGLAALIPFGIGDVLAATLEAAAIFVDAIAVTAVGLAMESAVIAGEFFWESNQSTRWWTSSNLQGFKAVVDVTTLAFQFGLVALGGAVSKLLKLAGDEALVRAGVIFAWGGYENQYDFRSYADTVVCNEEVDMGAKSCLPSL
jgi:RHS repeat-associated protein